MKVYISGAVTGKPDFNRAAFYMAEDYIASNGYKPINPLRATEYKHSKTWLDYMREDIVLLMSCDAIYMIPGWITSRGAWCERIIAWFLRYKVIK